MHHSILLNERFAVGASQSGGFVGLYDNPKDTSFEQRLETVFSFHYPDIIIHPNLAKMQPAHHLNSSKSHLAKHLICWSAPLGSQSHSLEKMDQRPIVGCTVSGGMVQVYRISSDLYRLLSVLEELLLQFEPTMPLLGTSLDFKEWYCGLSAGEESTIHGDLVELFLKLSRQEQHLLIRNSISDKLLTAIGPFLPENVPLSVNTDDDVENTVTLLREILLEFKI
jgi:hypothetical protein